MRLVLLLCGIALSLPLFAQSISVAEARAISQNTERWLVNLNEATANEYFHHGEFAKAVESLDRGIILSPTRVDPYAAAGWLLWSSERNDDAIAMYRRMVAANPKAPQAYFEFGLFYYNTWQNELCIEQMEKALALGLTSPYRHIYGHALVRLGRSEDALAFWRKVLAEDPNNAVAQNQITKLTTPTPAPPENPPEN